MRDIKAKTFGLTCFTDLSKISTVARVVALYRLIGDRDSRCTEFSETAPGCGESKSLRKWLLSLKKELKVFPFLEVKGPEG